jgi:hypothetical protein
MKLFNDIKIIKNKTKNKNEKRNIDLANRLLLELLFTEIKGKNIAVTIEDIKALINNVNLKAMLTIGNSLIS